MSWQVVLSWTVRQQVLAAFSAGFHFIFMILYVTFLTLSTSWASMQPSCPPWLVRPASFVALIQPVGGVFDVMLQSLNIASIAAITAGDEPTTSDRQAAVAFAVMHDIILAVAALISLFVLVRARLCGPRGSDRPTNEASKTHLSERLI